METRVYHPLRSLILSQAIQAEPQRCWRNAIIAVESFPKIFVGGSYVEGWVVGSGEQSIDLVEHGWCCTASLLLDPTLVLTRLMDQQWCELREQVLGEGLFFFFAHNGRAVPA